MEEIKDALYPALIELVHCNPSLRRHQDPELIWKDIWTLLSWNLHCSRSAKSVSSPNPWLFIPVSWSSRVDPPQSDAHGYAKWAVWHRFTYFCCLIIYLIDILPFKTSVVLKQTFKTVSLSTVLWELKSHPYLWGVYHLVVCFAV